MHKQCEKNTSGHTGVSFLDIIIYSVLKNVYYSQTSVFVTHLMANISAGTVLGKTGNYLERSAQYTMN